jgi:hypothetical protein
MIAREYMNKSGAFVFWGYEVKVVKGGGWPAAIFLCREELKEKRNKA